MDISVKPKHDRLVNWLGHPRRALWMGIGALVVALVFGCFSLSLLSLFTRSRTLVSNHYVEPTGSAITAHITISPGISKMTVSAQPDSTNLFDADVTYRGTLTFNHTGDTSKTITLKQDNDNNGFDFFNPFGANQPLIWNIRLSPSVPLDLSVNSGVGNTFLDLGQLKLTNLNILSGVGSVTVTLPVRACFERVY